MRFFSTSRALFCAIGLVLTADLTSARATPDKDVFNWDSIKFVYAFGDSYSFVQGTDGTANFRRVYMYLTVRMKLNHAQFHWELDRFVIYT